MYQGDVLEQVLYNKKKKIDIEIFTDSKPLVDSVSSSKQLELKIIGPVIADIKDKLVDKVISSIKWIPMKDMLADMLTKERVNTKDMDDVVIRNILERISNVKDRVY